MKSIEMSSQILVGIGRGRSSPAGEVVSSYASDILNTQQQIFWLTSSYPTKRDWKPVSCKRERLPNVLSKEESEIQSAIEESKLNFWE